MYDDHRADGGDASTGPARRSAAALPGGPDANRDLCAAFHAAGNRQEPSSTRTETAAHQSIAATKGGHPWLSLAGNRTIQRTMDSTRNWNQNSSRNCASSFNMVRRL